MLSHTNGNPQKLGGYTENVKWLCTRKKIQEIKKNCNPHEFMIQLFSRMCFKRNPKMYLG